MAKWTQKFYHSIVRAKNCFKTNSKTQKKKRRKSDFNSASYRAESVETN